MPQHEVAAPERAEGVTIREAMRRYSIDARALYLAERAGRLIGLRVGNRVYFSEAQLETLFGSHGTGLGDLSEPNVAA